MGKIIIKIPGDVREVYEITDELKVKALFKFLKNKRKDKLKELLDSITSENLHEEVDWGEPRGKEVW